MRSRPLLLTVIMFVGLLVLSLQTTRGQTHLKVMKMIPPGCSHNIQFPDLVIVSAQVTTADQYVVQIKNSGPCPAGVSRLGIYAVETAFLGKQETVHSTSLIKSVNIPSLAAGQTYTARAWAKHGVWRQVTQQKVPRLFIIDDKSQVQEGNEYNNTFEINQPLP